MNGPISPSRRRLLAGAGAALALGACAGPGAPGGGAARQTGVADVNGARLHYETAGDGEPIVLLHAFALDMRMWDDQFDAFAARHRVIRYDARGFGRSSVPVPSVAYSPADDLAALLEHLRVERPHVVGSSMGGRIAIDYAITHPDRLRTLTLIDPVVGGWAWSNAWLAAYAPVVQAGRRGDVAAAKAAWLALPLFAPAREQPAVAARLERMVTDYSGWHFTHADPARSLEPPAVTRLDRIQAPTLVLVGDRDHAEFRAMAERVEHGALRARRVSIAGVGHLPNMEAPGTISEALLGFVERAG